MQPRNSQATRGSLHIASRGRRRGVLPVRTRYATSRTSPPTCPCYMNTLTLRCPRMARRNAALPCSTAPPRVLAPLRSNLGLADPHAPRTGRTLPAATAAARSCGMGGAGTSAAGTRVPAATSFWYTVLHGLCGLRSAVLRQFAYRTVLGGFRVLAATSLWYTVLHEVGGLRAGGPASSCVWS